MAAVKLIANHDRALSLLNKGSYAEAEPFLREVVEETEGTKNEHGEESAGALRWEHYLAECLCGQGKFADAERFARAAHHHYESRFGNLDEDTLDSEYLLAESLHGQGKTDQALPLVQAAVRGFEENLKRGPDHLTTLKCKALYASILSAMGKNIDMKQLANSVVQSLDQYEEKAETRVAQNGRRLVECDRRNIQEVKSRVLGLLGETSVRKRHSMKENMVSMRTLSTRAPDSDDEGCSRLPSKTE